MSKFRKQTLNGIQWSLITKLGRQFILFIVGVILARLLSPNEFGLIAQILVITGFAVLFSELGFGAALIQKQDFEQEQVSSVFWVNIIAGVALTIIFILVAPYIAQFYNEPLLTPLTMFISITFAIGSLSIIQSTILTKELNFRKLAYVEIPASIVSGVVAIILAYNGFGVWSLAVQTVLFSLFNTIILWIVSSWRPSFTLSFKSIKELLGFSTNLLGTQSLNYWVRNIDNLLIGRYLGPNSLGVYSRAYSLMLFPLTNISNVIARVMFPSFSIIQEDKERVKNIFLKITRSIALITFPLMLGLIVTAAPFVITVFGSQWIEMIPVLQVLCIVGLTQSIITLIGNIYLSQGKADQQFRVGLVLRTNLILGIVIGLQWGVVGVAIGYSIASLINIYPNLYFAGRLINLKFIELVQNLSGIFLCAIGMALIVYMIGQLMPQDWPSWALLTIEVSVGMLAYFVLIHMFRLDAYIEVRTLLLEQARPYLKTVMPSQLDS
jgi:PST family polysaccharide transporter